MNKRTEKDIIEKALPHLTNKAEVCRDGVWLPVPADVYQKIVELLRATGSGSKPLKGEWRLGIIPQKKDNEHAIIITSNNVQDIIRSEYE